MRWLTSRELLVLHSQVIKETGGAEGVLNPGALESAVARPFTAFGGHALFPDLLSRVDALIHSIISLHPFADGNKRTALVSADVCRRMHGFRIVPSPEVEAFFWSIASGEQEIEAIAQWLKGHTEPWTESTDGGTVMS